jgi:hypothetical protein
MAIKGKTKGRSRRVVAAPPRPTVYVRKKPLFARPWFLALLAALAIGGILTGVLTSMASSNRKELHDRTASAVTQFATAVEGVFPPAPDSQALPPTGYAMYPTLADDLDKVAKGDKEVDGAKKGASLAESAKASGDAIAKLNVQRIVPADANVSEGPGLRGPGATRLVLIESRFLIEQAFRIYEQIGGLMAQAAGLEGKARTGVIDRANALTTQAGRVFRQGYQKIQTLRAELGILERNPFPTAGGGLGGA